MRRVAVLVAVACLTGVGGLVVAAAPGSAQGEDCRPGRACVYPGDNYGGGRVDFDKAQYEGPCITIEYRSIKNRTADENVFVYPDEHCDGRSGMTQVQPGNDLITGDHRSLRLTRNLWPDQQP